MNASHIFLSRLRQNEVSLIEKELSNFDSEDTFKKLFNYATEQPHSFLLINLKTNKYYKNFSAEIAPEEEKKEEEKKEEEEKDEHDIEIIKQLKDS